MNGNGCAGSTASGVTTGKTRSMNQASSQDLVAVGQAFGAAKRNPGLTQQAEKFAQDALLVGQQQFGALLDGGQLLRRGAAIGRDQGGACLRLPDQRGDADRVELVEVGCADRQEAQPLQQRVARVLRLLQDAVVEIQPGQLAVDETFRAVEATLGLRFAMLTSP